MAAIIADEAAIGMVNNKTTAVRLLVTPGKTVGDTIEMGGLLGSAPVMPVHRESSADFIALWGAPSAAHSSGRTRRRRFTSAWRLPLIGTR